MSKPVNKQAIYSSISSRHAELIERLFELTKSGNESVSLGACKALLDRVIPPVKPVQLIEVSSLNYLELHDMVSSINQYKNSQLFDQIPLERLEAVKSGELISEE